MTEVAELLARVEAATGPDRELDAWLCAKLRYGPLAIAEINMLGQWTVRAHIDGAPNNHTRLMHVGETISPLTASLDAALALCERVLPGWLRVFGEHQSTQPDGPNFWRACLFYPAAVRTKNADASTPALALLAALLKAKANRTMDECGAEKEPLPLTEWRRHSGGKNPLPGGLVDLIWGYGIVERQSSERVNWSFHWKWKPSADARKHSSPRQVNGESPRETPNQTDGAA